MDNNNELNNTTNFNEGENLNTTPNQPSTYNSYYNHKPKKKHWGLLISFILFVIMIIIVLWKLGYFETIDRQSEYNRTFANICNASVTYADTEYKEAKKVPGKIVYVTIKEIIDANLIPTSPYNYLTDEPIAFSDYVKLEVLPNGDFQCDGFPEEDLVKPIITLKGDATITVAAGTKATDPGATATDDQDGDISDNIVRSGNVDTSISGTYTVTYTVADRAGNVSDRVIRTYIVQ